MSSLTRTRLSRAGRASFTLVELLVAMAVMVILLTIIAMVTQGTAQAIHQASGKLSTYAAARSAFDTMNEKLAQATLNTYMDYWGTNASGTVSLQTSITNTTWFPCMYGRVSDLQFIVKQNSNPAVSWNQTASSGTGYGEEVYFQCPVAYSTTQTYQSAQGLLNACGYYVEYGSDATFRPSAIAATGHRWRYRLMQAIEPTETMQVYQYAISDDPTDWTKNIVNSGPGVAPATDAIPLADNVIALVIWPRLPTALDSTGTNLAPYYTYDSQSNAAPVAVSGGTGTQPITAHQLPPILQVTMVVIDEASATRIDTGSSTPPAKIETALTGRFTSAANYATDLSAVGAALSANHIGYEVLNTSIVLRESKWSQ